MQFSLIYIDLDGVLVDILKGLCTLFKLPHLYDRWPQNDRVSRVLGISDAAVWKAVACHSPRWWVQLPVYPHARELVGMLQDHAPIRICTRPAEDPMSAAGKLIWMQNFFGDWAFDHYHLTRHKEELARPDRLLVDDQDHNCEAFAAAGGQVIQFPQPYNRLRKVYLAGEAMGYVRDEFQRLLAL